MISQVTNLNPIFPVFIIFRHLIQIQRRHYNICPKALEDKLHLKNHIYIKNGSTHHEQSHQNIEIKLLNFYMNNFTVFQIGISR